MIPLPLLPTSVQTASRRDKEDDRCIVEDEVKKEIGVESHEIQEAETAVMKAMRVGHASNGLMSVLTNKAQIAKQAREMVKLKRMMRHLQKGRSREPSEIVDLTADDSDRVDGNVVE